MELKKMETSPEEGASMAAIGNAITNAEDFASRFGGKWHVVELEDGSVKVRDDAKVINNNLKSIYDTNLKTLYPGDFSEEYYNDKKQGGEQINVA